MPLIKSGSAKAVGHNIKEMVKSGYKPKQAIAASLANQRRYKKMAMGGQTVEDGGMGDIPKEDESMEEDKFFENEHEQERERHMHMGGYYEGGMVEDGRDLKREKFGEREGGYDKENVIEPETEEQDTENPLTFHLSSGGLTKDESNEEMGETGPDDEKRSLNEIRKKGEYYPATVANPVRLSQRQEFARALHERALMDHRDEGDEKAYAEGGLVQDEYDGDEPVGNLPEDIVDRPESEEPMSAEPAKPDGLEHAKEDEFQGDGGLSELAKEAIRKKRASRRYGMYNPSAK